MEKKKIQIQTHSGGFHADDVTAVTLLTNFYNDLGHEVTIVRSRNPETFPESDILVDVGKEYNPLQGKFDHHQESCQETWNDKCSIPLSSVGMVWKEYGHLILKRFLKGKNVTEDDIKALKDKIYFSLILELDANDNGISTVEGGKRNYWSNLNLPSIISSCNGKDTTDDQKQDEKFSIAMTLVTQILEIKFNHVIESYFNHQKDLEYVRGMIDPSLEYLVVPSNCPTVYKCLSDLDPDFRIKFLVFLSDLEITVKTRGKEPFQNLVDILPQKILEKRLTDPDSLIFVHKNLFIAKSKTVETALEIIKLSLEYHNDIFNRVKRTLFEKSSLTKVAAVGAIGIVGSYLYLKSSDN